MVAHGGVILHVEQLEDEDDGGEEDEGGEEDKDGDGKGVETPRRSSTDPGRSSTDPA